MLAHQSTEVIRTLPKHFSLFWKPRRVHHSRLSAIPSLLGDRSESRKALIGAPWWSSDLEYSIARW